jgi:sarcosine oxidase subunit beta
MIVDNRILVSYQMSFDHPGCEVAVVGGGVTGLSIGWHLAKAGVAVSIFEREGVNAGASGVQPGGVRQQWTTRLSCEMAREAVSFYSELGDRLGVEGAPTLERCGYLFVAHSPGELDRLRRAVALQNECGVPSRVVSAHEAEQLVPGLRATGTLGAGYCAEDGYFDRPQAVVELFAQAAVRSGAELRIEEVASLERNSRNWQLILADSSRVSADHVVLACGYDTPQLARSVGVDLPIRKEARYLFFSNPIRERILEPLVVAPERHLAAKQLADGRVLASYLSARGNPEANRAQWLAGITAGIAELLPVLEFVPFAYLVEGFYDVTPDHQPILGPIPGFDGLVVAAGFSGHGFMMAPTVGARIAAAVTGGSVHPSVGALSLGRFEPGSGGLERELQIV